MPLIGTPGSGTAMFLLMGRPPGSTNLNEREQRLKQEAAYAKAQRDAEKERRKLEQARLKEERARNKKER